MQSLKINSEVMACKFKPWHLGQGDNAGESAVTLLPKIVPSSCLATCLLNELL